MISQKARYALRALILLAQAHGRGEALIIAEIAERQSIPHKFLEQILLDLKRQGLLESRRGKNGGYALLKPADRITFGEVLRIVDGPLAPLPCLSRVAYRPCEDCDSEEACEIRRVFARVTEATRAVLDTTTLADALAGRAPAVDPLPAAPKATRAAGQG
ncbi:BadM/Rrf2 family transcriptional regulator [Rhodothalassium salexigens DSM 2132]|uniref:BadM/Rrf2 family transcriptional regulator n=1 Tax=Rhodothalassium salexigens DSM 2132 TaxID=1188247 RepID=A0A4R2PU55_RHOSA|nr:Rrf2 family transcriptional regulator [Rhodothalassium salexigens]MBB4210414.1 Rrf2 family protein [Rhodothalassium salexigens DSM 2132]MBK1640061.1 transcriptional regulator [Rhodothalassium salexigens DSM 2132]TCP38578.1 BadM/Rrf2 family transcriptional regulator [Rhodothalassium salexigens DSM 2132]